MWDNAEAEKFGCCLKIGFAIFEEFHVAMELVDDEALEALPVVFIKDGQGADDGGDDAAPVDVAHEESWNIDGPGKAHICQIAIPQIDFGGAAGTLHDDEVGLRREFLEAFHDGWHELLAVFEEIPRRHGGRPFALDDDLGTRIGFRFQEHGVHVDGCGLAGGAGLERLGPADFAAVLGDGGIVGHVLRFEGHDFQSAIGKSPAQAGGHQGLAHVGAGAHQHEGARAHGASHIIWA